MKLRLPFFPEQASSFAHEVDALTVWLVGMSAFFTAAHRSDSCSSSRSSTGAAHPSRSAKKLRRIARCSSSSGRRFRSSSCSSPSSGEPRSTSGSTGPRRAPSSTTSRPNSGCGRRSTRPGTARSTSCTCPSGQPTRLTMTSEDVIHSFFVPAFRAKADVLPGRYTTMWFTSHQAGALPALLRRVLRRRALADDRLGHGAGAGGVSALARERAGAGDARRAGEKIFERLACQDCHAAASASWSVARRPLRPRGAAGERRRP
jgi:hypothetical protein